MAGGSGSGFSPRVQSQNVPSGSNNFFLSESNLFSGGRAMLSLEDVHGGGAKSCRSFFQSFVIMEDDLDDYLQQPEKRRRLTADQVRFLEKSFKLENKLEPERKVRIAKDLGLQPRQIAIWFQNRRARGKTKQIEKDYDTLQASYNALKADYDALVKERDQLKDQVHDLANNLVQNPTVGSVSKEEAPKSPNILRTKHEEICSGKSDILDSDSPHFTDCGHSSRLVPGDSSYMFEPDQSDISQDEEDSLMPAHIPFPKLENNHFAGPPATNACGFEFSADDPTFWSWPY